MKPLRTAMPEAWRKALPVLFLVCLMPFRAQAQFGSATVRAVVGERAGLPLLYSGSERSITLKGKFLLSNSTVFYPERFLSAQNMLGGISIGRENDSLYNFEFTAERADTASDTLALLEGLALAGSDSLCDVRFFDIEASAEPVADFLGKVITQSFIPSPYVRFALLEQSYPNPAPPSVLISWPFRIDKPSDVTFRIYDTRGREVHSDLLPGLARGVYIYRLTPVDKDFPPGIYWVRMISSSGESTLPMVIAE